MVFLIRLLNNSKSFNSLWNFNQFKHTWFLFYLFSHSKILGCDRLPPLKEISSSRFGEARKKNGFEVLGGLPPLKETFVGTLGLGFRRGTPWFWLGTGSSLYHMLLLRSFPIGGCHSIASNLPQGGLSITSSIERLQSNSDICWAYFGHWRVTLWVYQKAKLRCSWSFISYPYLIFIDFYLRIETSCIPLLDILSHLQR
jgi:hypothetical protein